MDLNSGREFIAAHGTDPNDWRNLGLHKRVEEIIKRTDLDPQLVQHISETLQVLNDARNNGKLNVTENQKAFVNLVSDLGSKDIDTVQQRFAELEHAAYVLKRGNLDANTPIVIGAEYNQQLKNLPKIDVEKVEADTYYKTADGVIHLDEVKNTPNALVSKLREQQFDRYAQWMNEGINLPTEEERVVGVYIRQTGPGFDQILDSGRFQRLSSTIVSDDTKPFMKVGEYTFSLNDLKNIQQDAFQKLTEIINENKRNGVKVKPSDLAKQYFGSLETTFQTLGKIYGQKS